MRLFHQLMQFFVRELNVASNFQKVLSAHKEDGSPKVAQPEGTGFNKIKQRIVLENSFVQFSGQF